jgi:acetylglutamate kinase
MAAPDPHEQAEILVHALPHMLRYDDATVVVKYGGHAMGDEQVARDFAKDMILLEQSGVNPVVVHGGGLVSATYHLSLWPTITSPTSC